MSMDASSPPRTHRSEYSLSSLPLSPLHPSPHSSLCSSDPAPSTDSCCLSGPVTGAGPHFRKKGHTAGDEGGRECCSAAGSLGQAPAVSCDPGPRATSQSLFALHVPQLACPNVGRRMGDPIQDIVRCTVPSSWVRVPARPSVLREPLWLPAPGDMALPST